MTAVALPVRQGTPEWLEARKAGIGSSDAPIIAGEKGSVARLWAEKQGLVEPLERDPEEQELLDWGKRLEAAIAEGYTETTGRPVRRVNRLLRHGQVEWALASLDRVSARKGERRVVELKNTHWRAAAWDGDEPPGDVMAQIQHQLWVTGYDVADVVVLISGHRLGLHEVGRDDDYIADLVYLERDFQRHRELGTRPPVDGSEETRRILARLWSREDGLILPATLEVDELFTELLAAKASLKDAEARAGTASNAMRALIGSATGYLGRGYKVTWTQNRGSLETAWDAVAAAYEQALAALVASHPGLQAELDAMGLADPETVRSLHSATKPGPRVLRTHLFKEKEKAA